MCGISGAIGDTSEKVIKGMLERIRHRGPDASGFKILDDVSIGNVRLSIIDVAGGNQPLSDANEDCSALKKATDSKLIRTQKFYFLFIRSMV